MSDDPPAPDTPAPAAEAQPRPSIMDDEAVRQQMQNEVCALLAAWSDRGATTNEGVNFLMATSHLIACTFGASLGQVVALAAQQWDKFGGRL